MQTEYQLLRTVQVGNSPLDRTKTCKTIEDLFETSNNKFKPQEIDRHLKEHFINGLNDDCIIVDIIFATITDTITVKMS